MKVLASQFIYSVPDVKLMQDFGEEMVIIGRSNSGKSSLINALCQKKDLAKTSKTPGRTRHAVVYQVEFVQEEVKKVVTLVDLPGYGYAKMSKVEALACEKLIQSYLQKRKPLRLVFLLLDIRREPEQREIAFLNIMQERGLKAVVVLTKCDKISVSRRKPLQTRVAKALNLAPDQVMLHSKELPRKTNDLRKIIFSSLI